MELEEQTVFSLAGGIMQHGYQCGMIWGATLAAGAQAYRQFGPGPQAEVGAIRAAQRLVESFQKQNKEINCLEITDIDNSSSGLQMFTYFFIKGGTIQCGRMAINYAPVAFYTINAALAAAQIDPPVPPVSCAALVAQKMGVSDKHQAMAAGLAGGIGLCGGGCGALGAAIWIIEMDSRKEGSGKSDFKNPRALAAIEKFMKCTDYEFECAEIVGRKFENVEDHAAYVREGGCEKIIEALATA
jgi:hypothetical protein